MNLEQALDAFLARQERSAFRMAQVSTGSTDDALDIVQDAMMRFVERYSRKEQQAWKPLFYRVLNSRITDWHRRRKVRMSIMRLFGDGDQDIDQLAAQTPKPDQQWQASQAMQTLESALQALPLRQQQAVMHRVWDGMDTQQTAIAMGVSSGSVKTHLSRGLQRLQQQLGEHWP